MTCRECELALAGEEKSREVNAHVAVCESCRILAADLQANLQAMHEFGAEPMPALRRRKQAWPWVAAGVAAAVAMAAMWVVMMVAPVGHRQPEARSLTVDSAARSLTFVAQKKGVAASRVAAKGVAPNRVAAKSVAAGAVPRHRARRKAEPQILQVKMLTDDPNVVIYWQVVKGSE